MYTLRVSIFNFRFNFIVLVPMSDADIPIWKYMYMYAYHENFRVYMNPRFPLVEACWPVGSAILALCRPQKWYQCLLFKMIFFFILTSAHLTWILYSVYLQACICCLQFGRQFCNCVQFRHILGNVQIFLCWHRHGSGFWKIFIANQ